jgi:hypothetical protein
MEEAMAVLRRSVWAILAILVVCGDAAFAASGRGPTWDGTWAGGWESREGVQITFVGQKLIGFFLGDYRDAITADGKTVTFSWAGGESTLQRTGEDKAQMRLRVRGRAERSFTVERE